MFAWAAGSLEKLAQTVAPPPQDAASRFVYCVQKNDEAGAQGCLAEIDPYTVVQPNRGTCPLHLACLHGMDRLVVQLMGIPGANIQLVDGSGNTPLHYACMNNNPKTALTNVRRLVTEFKASVVAKNFSHQTPYDVATINSVRQYLLPLQLQQETQHALDNGGVGLPPGIDMGGMQVRNSNLAPPPMSMPTGTPTHQHSGHPPLFTTPSPSMPSSASTPNMPVSAPTSAPHEHARTGHSSVGVMPSNSKYRPDGFHSSSSDVNLQKKYGHVSSGNLAAVPPPPSSGNNSLGGPPALSGPNPYAMGGPPKTKSRYLAYDGSALSSSTAQFPAPNSGYGYFNPATPNVANFATFNPVSVAHTGNQDQAQPSSSVFATQQQASPGQQQYQQPTYPAQQQYQQPSYPAQQQYQQPTYPTQQQYQQPAYPTQQQYQHATSSPAYLTEQQQQEYQPPATPASSSILSPPPLSSVTTSQSPTGQEEHPSSCPPSSGNRTTPFGPLTGHGSSPYTPSSGNGSSPFAAPRSGNSPYVAQSHKALTPQDAVDAFSAPPSTTFETPLKDTLPAKKPILHHAASTGSTASTAQDLFSGPSPDKHEAHGSVPETEMSPADIFGCAPQSESSELKPKLEQEEVAKSNEHDTTDLSRDDYTEEFGMEDVPLASPEVSMSAPQHETAPTSASAQDFFSSSTLPPPPFSCNQ